MLIIAKFTDEQYATINQSTAGRFDPRVFVNCLQVSTCNQSTTGRFDPRVFVNCLQVSTCKQLTKTLGSKRPAVD